MSRKYKRKRIQIHTGKRGGKKTSVRHFFPSSLNVVSFLFIKLKSLFYSLLKMCDDGIKIILSRNQCDSHSGMIKNLIEKIETRP